MTNRWGKRFFIVLAVGAIALSGCGKTEDLSSDPEVSQPTISEQPEETNQVGKQKEEVEAATRTVKDEYGDVTIPAKPQRVAAIYLEDYLKALDVEPVVQWYHPNWGIQEYLQLDAPQFDITGTMEALLEFSPDLIIVDGGADKVKTEQYALIAPTYHIPEKNLQSAEDILKIVADVLNIPEKADVVLAEYEQKIKAAKEQFDIFPANETVAVIRINTGDKTIALFGEKNRFAGEIYRTFGLTPHPLAAKMEGFQEILSEEGFSQLDADHIIVFPSNGNWETTENQSSYELLNSRLWENVPAFQKNQVYKFDRSHWQSGGITANMQKLDDLIDIFNKKR